MWKHGFLPSRLLLFICSCLFDLKCWMLLARTCIKWYSWVCFSPHQLTNIHHPAVTEHQGCYHRNYSFLQKHPRGEDIGSILEIEKKKHSYLLSAPTLARHTLRSMQTALTRTCRKTQVNRQKHTLADAHSRSLRSVGSQQESQSVRLFFPPTSFLPGSHVCLALPSVLHAVEQTCLWLQNFHKVESMSSGVLQKWKTRGKVSRSESGFGFNSHLGPLSCLVTHVLILKSVILCVSVCSSFETNKWT